MILINIEVKTYNNWIHINNRSRTDEFDGCWFGYLPQNIRNHDRKIVEKLKEITQSYGFIKCEVEEHYYDTIRIYTTCKRDEIYVAKNVLNKVLNVSEENMFWVSEEESKQFKSGDGWLKHLNNFFAKK